MYASPRPAAASFRHPRRLVSLNPLTITMTRVSYVAWCVGCWYIWCQVVVLSLVCGQAMRWYVYKAVNNTQTMCIFRMLCALYATRDYGRLYYITAFGSGGCGQAHAPSQPVLGYLLERNVFRSTVHFCVWRGMWTGTCAGSRCRGCSRRSSRAAPPTCSALGC